LKQAIQKGKKKARLRQMITFYRHLLSFKALTMGLMREANILKQTIQKGKKKARLPKNIHLLRTSS
jgi:hypothetical protein